MTITMLLVITLLAISLQLSVGARPSLAVTQVHEIPEALPSFSLASATGTNEPSSGWANGCSYTYNPPSGAPIVYDLSAMTKSAGDYQGQDTAYTYKANVCGTSVGGGTGCTDKAASICQFNIQTAALTASLGSYSASGDPTWSLITLPGAAPEPYTAGVMYTYTNGDMCWIAGQEKMRTTLNVFRCSQTPSDLITISEDPLTCVFTVTFQSTQACPGAGPTPSTGGGTGTVINVTVGISGGWIFIIILLVVIPIYIAVGCIYKVKKGGAAFGRDSCPNGDFWGSIPGLVKDGCKYTFYMIKSGCKNGKGEAYNEL